MGASILNMSVLHLIIPIICTSALFVSLCLFIYLYLRFKDKVYLTMIVSGILAIGFAGSDLVITVFGELLNNVTMGMQFHRIEQLSGVFYLFCIPLLIINILKLNQKWQKINKMLAIAGLIISLSFTLSAFIYPDSFISQTTLQATGHNITWHIARGSEGILYLVRDILLAISLLYGFVCLMADMYWNRQYKRTSFMLVGFIFVAFGAIDDAIYVHTGSYTGLVSDVFFSRVSTGISLFTLSIMSGVINQFIEEVKNVEKAYKAKNNAYRTLRKSNERFKQLAENINEIFFIYDYDNEVFLYISPAYENLSGHSSLSLYASPQLWMDVVYPEDAETVKSLIGDGKIQDEYDIEYRIVLPDSSVRWIRDRGFPVRDDEGEPYRMVRTQEDITNRKKSEERLVYLAFYDVLTGLLNRRSFFERLDDIVAQSVREKDILKVVLLIGLDGFNTINNTFGHDFGDEILKLVAERLARCLRGTDYIFRISGNEFAVILKNISADIDASIVANKIVTELSMPYNFDIREVFISCCVGISIYPKDSKESLTLVKHAHLALNEAKKERNAYKFFDREMNTRALERLTIESNLRHAVSKDEFSVYYQPFVNIDGKITGMEALIRWNTPAIKSVFPDKFIPIAESTGQIIAVGEWVLRTACNQVKNWLDSGYRDLRVAVNISAVQLMDKRFVERVSSVVEDTELSPDCLELEITESSVMRTPEDAISKINKLHDRGISFSVDDFGVDYSSLSYIKRFKIDHLKIPRTFIMDITNDSIAAEITKAIIGMAHNLNIKVIAEGIETREQKEFLESLKCDEMQGFFFSHPLPANEFKKLLDKGEIRL